ncbi:MAG TPA: cupin domain-containing protein [Candidatus Dormibacteraeota bacterium]|nr:cupin domain-containing protein [Candidatus Dormibacteraeota bacterium]
MPLFGRGESGPEVLPVPRGEWTPLNAPGCRNVEGRVFVAESELSVAMLRFGPDATINEHQADHETEVVCLEGSGFTSVAGREAEIRAGQRVNWPAQRPHRLWTAGSPMVTLMVEHPRQYRP